MPTEFLPLQFSVMIDRVGYRALDDCPAPFDDRSEHTGSSNNDLRIGNEDYYVIAWDGRADLGVIARGGGTLTYRHSFERTMPGFSMEEALRPLDWYLGHPELRTHLRYEHGIAIPNYMESGQPIGARFWRDEPGSLVCRVTICHLDGESQSGVLRMSAGISFGKHASRIHTGWPKARIIDSTLDRMMPTPIWRQAGARLVDADPGGNSHTDLSIACDQEVVSISSRAVPFDGPTDTVQNVFGVAIKVPRTNVREVLIETMRHLAHDALLTGISGQFHDDVVPQFTGGHALEQLQSFRKRVATGSSGWYISGLMSVPHEMIDRLIWDGPAPAEPVLLPIFGWLRTRKKENLEGERWYQAALWREDEERRLVISTVGINEAAQLKEIEEITGIIGWTRDLPPDGLPVSDLEPIVDMSLD